MNLSHILVTLLAAASIANSNAQNKVKVLFLGDSLTDGFCNDFVSYADKLRTDGIVDEASFKKAVTGQLLRSMSDYVTDEQLASVELVSIMGGTNQIDASYYNLGTIDDEPTPDNHQQGKKYSVGDKVMGGTTEQYGIISDGAVVNDIVHRAMYVCTKAGTSSSKDITWKETVGTTTKDNTVSWKCVGYSSFYGDMKRNIKRILAANPEAHIVFICPTYMAKVATENDNIRQQNAAIRHLCSVYGIDYFDLCTLLPVEETNDNGNWDYFYTDMVHFNDAGHEKVKSLMADHYFSTYVSGTREASYTLSLTDARWATLCVPFSFEVPEGLTLYSVSGIQADGATLELESVSAPADNVPYLVYGAAGEYELHGKLVMKSSADEGYLSNGLLTGSLVESLFVPKDSYVLQNLEGKTSFYRVDLDETISINSRHAYLSLPTSSTEAPRILVTPDAAGIEQIDASTANAPTMQRDLWGRRCSDATFGFRIVTMSDGSTRKVLR